MIHDGFQKVHTRTNCHVVGQERVFSNRSWCRWLRWSQGRNDVFFQIFSTGKMVILLGWYPENHSHMPFFGWICGYLLGPNPFQRAATGGLNS